MPVISGEFRQAVGASISGKAAESCIGDRRRHFGKERRRRLLDRLVVDDPELHVRQGEQGALAHIDARLVLAHEALPLQIDEDFPCAGGIAG